MNIWIFYCPKCDNPTYTENRFLKIRKCGHCNFAINFQNTKKTKYTIPSLKYAPALVREIYKYRMEIFYNELKKEAEERFTK